MAQPFFRGNYGSALARVDTRPIMEAGRAQGQMYANLGGQIGGMIKEYGLNKQKKEKATSEVENMLELYPEYADRLTQSGDETTDKKNLTTLDKLQKGELGLAGLEGLAGKLALMEKQDKKERDEAEMRRQIALDMLKREQISLDMNVKREGLAAEKEKSLSRDNYFAGLNRDLDEALDLLKSDPGAKLGSKFAKLVANQDAVRNKQGDIAFYQSDPTEDELKRIRTESAQQGLTKDRQDIQLGEIALEQKKVESKGGKYDTIDKVSAELARLANQGTTASAVRNKSGGFDITNVQAVKKQNLTEFDPAKHPGVYSDINNNLYKMDKNGKPVSIGGDKTAQAQGQKLDFLRMKQRQVNDGYLSFKQNGELKERGSVRDTIPDDDTDPNDLYYKWNGEYRKYDQDEEDLISDIEILTELIGSGLDFDLDVTP